MTGGNYPVGTWWWNEEEREDLTGGSRNRDRVGTIGTHTGPRAISTPSCPLRAYTPLRVHPVLLYALSHHSLPHSHHYTNLPFNHSLFHS